jgi:hypothetical protein
MKCLRSKKRLSGPLLTTKGRGDVDFEGVGGTWTWGRGDVDLPSAIQHNFMSLTIAAGGVERD